MVAEDIYGPDIGSLKGKTVRAPVPKVRITPTVLPASLFERIQELTMCCDIMYVNRIPFVMMYVRKIRYGMAGFIPSNTAKHLRTAILPMIKEMK